MSPKHLWLILKDAALEWLEDKAPRLGAALAYYTIFSLAPLLVIVIAIAGALFGEQAAQGQLIDQLQGLVGQEGGRAVEAMLASADRPQGMTIASVLGVIMLVFGATAVFVQLQDALNTVWEVQPKPDRGIWGLIRDRLLSFGMVLGVAFLLLVSLVVSTALAALGGLFGEWQASAVGQAVHAVISFGIVTLLFAMIYRFLPDAEVSWKDVWFGSLFTAALFTVGKFLIGLYLGRSSVGSAYGAAGSFAVLLIWTYYSAQIFLYGAELTKAYAEHFGTRIKPKAHAEMVTEEQRAQEGRPQAPVRDRRESGTTTRPTS